MSLFSGDSAEFTWVKGVMHCQLQMVLTGITSKEVTVLASWDSVT